MIATDVMQIKEKIESLGGRLSSIEGGIAVEFYHASFSEDDFNCISVNVDFLAVYGSNLDDVLLIKLLDSIASNKYFFAYCPRLTDNSADVLKELSLSKEVKLLDVGISHEKINSINLRG